MVKPAHPKTLSFLFLKYFILPLFFSSSAVLFIQLAGNCKHG
ncbi:hypothetical protein ACU8KH_00580 [Lachancea thermotolerans]